MNREQERLVDVVVYIACLSHSAYRHAKGLPPFNIEDVSTAEFLVSRCLPFLENEDVSYKVAHQSFLQIMFENGWHYDPKEDFINRLHPDLIPWSQLSRVSKEQYAYTAALVFSARNFYLALKTDLENEFVDSFSPDLQTRSITALSGVDH